LTDATKELVAENCPDTLHTIYAKNLIAKRDRLMRTSGIGDSIEYITREVEYHKKRACRIRDNGYSVAEHGRITVSIVNGRYYLQDGLHRSAILIALGRQIASEMIQVRDRA